MKLGLRSHSISSRFQLVMAMTFLGAIVFAVVMVTSHRAIQIEENRRNEVHLLQKGVFELNVLTQDYLLTGSARALRQWHSKYATLHSQIVNLSAFPSGNVELISRIGHDLMELRRMFEEFQVRRRAEMSAPRLEQISNQAQYLAHDVSAKLSQLYWSVSSDYRQREFLFWSSLLIFFLISKSVVGTVTYVMWKQSVRSIKLFKEGIKAISEGKLPSISQLSNDEFGNLLRDVNQLGKTIESRQKGTLDELKKQRQIAEDASNAKNIFLANVSHEIRTPLSIIDGYTKLLIDSPDVNPRTNLAKIHWNVNYILRLVNDILDLSKIEAKKLDIEPRPFSVTNLSSFFESMALKAEEKNLTFRVVCDTPIPRQITSDLTRMEQVLANLIGNAIKYSKAGQITVHMRLAEPWLIFEVEDTGIGIPADVARKIFEPFYQLYPSEFDGTGLGLTLSRDIAKCLGGDVYLKETEVGKGSIFVFECCVGAINPTQMVSTSSFASPMTHVVAVDPLLRSSETQKKEAFWGIKILAAEDNEDLRYLLEQVLEDSGAELVFVDNGLDAVKFALDPELSFDLVLMDIQLPGLDGYAATREIRKGNKTIPIIACSARIMKEEMDRGIEAGMSAYVEKPLSLTKLQSIMQSELVFSRRAER